MRIIVVGSHGFVGHWLCEAFKEQKYSVLGLDIHGIDSQHCDIRNKQDLSAIDFTEEDNVVFLAGRQYADKPPKKNRQAFFDEVNLEGLHNVLSEMQQKRCQRLVYFSSDMVYGLPGQPRIDEAHQTKPIGEYGLSKVKAEQLCQQFRERGMSITIFRPRLIIGPGRLGVLTQLFSLIKRNLPVPLIGRGDNCYQMISVHDCVTAILLAVQAGCPNYTLNLGSKERISVKDLLQSLIVENQSKSRLLPVNARLCQQLLKTIGSLGLEILYKEQYLIANQNYFLNIDAAANLLQWQPQYSDQQMLAAAYSWYLNHHD